MQDELNRLRTDALAQLASIWDDATLEEWRVKYLGRKGAISSVMEKLGTLPKDERGTVGKLANETKNELEAAYNTKMGAMKQRALSESLEAEPLDVTLPGRSVVRGSNVGFRLYYLECDTCLH